MVKNTTQLCRGTGANRSVPLPPTGRERNAARANVVGVLLLAGCFGACSPTGCNFSTHVYGKDGGHCGDAPIRFGHFPIAGEMVKFRFRIDEKSHVALPFFASPQPTVTVQVRDPSGTSVAHV